MRMRVLVGTLATLICSVSCGPSKPDYKVAVSMAGIVAGPTLRQWGETGVLPRSVNLNYLGWEKRVIEDRMKSEFGYQSYSVATKPGVGIVVEMSGQYTVKVVYRTPKAEPQIEFK